MSATVTTVYTYLPEGPHDPLGPTPGIALGRITQPGPARAGNVEFVFTDDPAPSRGWAADLAEGRLPSH